MSRAALVLTLLAARLTAEAFVHKPRPTRRTRCYDGPGGFPGLDGPNSFPDDPRIKKAFEPEWTAEELASAAEELTLDETVQRPDKVFGQLREMLDFMAKMGGDGSVPPHLLTKYHDALLDGSAYDYVFAERRERAALEAQNAADDEEAEHAIRELEALERVDAFLRGYLSAERRRRSRATFEAILAATMEGPTAFDARMAALRAGGALDRNLDEYLDEVAGKAARAVAMLETSEAGPPPMSPLMRVVEIVQDRIKAEKTADLNPAIRIFAQCLALTESANRFQLLSDKLNTLDIAVELTNLVEASIDYLEPDADEEEGEDAAPPREEKSPEEQKKFEEAVEAIEAMGIDVAGAEKKTTVEKQAFLREILRDIRKVVAAQAPTANLDELKGL